ncbi:MAG: carboxypeptidase-like regulatory domain-containing protein [candidate division WOR-3 bacterium]|nr:carboxypeptidase-like regulatory domain-containing protein [candidate division WOR-3 bacterium]
MMRLLPFVFALILFLSCAVFTSSGLVEVGTIFGFVSDDELNPIADAEVVVVGETKIIAYTNSAGYYILQDLPAGDLTLVFSCPGYESRTISCRVEPGKKMEIDQILKKIKTKEGSVRGIVVDYLTNEPLVAEITIMELNRSTTSDKNGFFEFENIPAGFYLMKVQALNYVTSQTDIKVEDGKSTEQMIRIFREGSVITLHGVVFEFNSAILRPESYPVLDDAARILTMHPEIDVEIQGHTDNIGSDEYNLKLSQKRAEAVRDYLIDKHMIEPVRLIPVGYGERRPIADNSTEEGRQKNRRVEFLILRKKE